MDRPSILDGVYDACAELLKSDRSTLTEDTSFADDLEADSLDLAEVVMALEDKWNIEIPEEDLENVRTLGQAADLVGRHLDAAA